MERRRDFLRAGIAAGTAGIAGCPGVPFLGGESMSWAEAFTEGTSEQDRAVLQATPVVVSEVESEREVTTALGVLAWTLEADDMSATFLSELEGLAEAAGRVREQLDVVREVLSRGLKLVDKMKNTSAAGVSVWSAATWLSRRSESSRT